VDVFHEIIEGRDRPENIELLEDLPFPLFGYHVNEPRPG